VTQENFENMLEAFLAAQPFRIFTVGLNGGRRFEVDNPNPRAVVYRGGVAVFVAPGGIPMYFDRESVNLVADVPANRLD